MDMIKRQNLLRGLGVIALLALVILAFNPARTLLSFQKNDQVPLYTMSYYGAYYGLTPLVPYNDADLRKYGELNDQESGTSPEEFQACTIFSATGGDQMIYGRNRDLSTKNKALLLFTHPKNGYASVSMVDLDQLEYYPDRFSLWRWLRLLAAPLVPTEGMNEYGLTVSKADVSPDDPPFDQTKESLMFRTAMRLVLDQARTTQEALDLLAQYNITFGWGGGHLLIADPSGDSAIVEFFNDEMVVIRDSNPWQVITNFEVGNTDDMSQEGSYERYRIVNQALEEANGAINIDQGLDILQQASVSSTLWSVSFDMTSKEIYIAMYHQYDQVFQLIREQW